MTIEIADFQFELGGVVFGLYSPDGITTEDGGWDPGASDTRTQDNVLPQRDGAVFGRDFIDGKTWAWTLSTDFDDDDLPDMDPPDGSPVTAPGGGLLVGGAVTQAMLNAMNAVERLETAWKDPAIRLVPGAVTAARYRLLGRTRRVYGRPRNFAASLTNRALSGYIQIVCDFKTVDSLTYSDTQSSLLIQLTPNADGGWKFPARFPVTPHPFVDRSGQAISAGTSKTWPTITITGPITVPTLDGQGWSLTLNATIPLGQSITVDTRPWVQTIRWNDGRNASGTLSPRQRLRDIQIVPGNQQLSLFGNTSGVGASALITWRDAWTAL